MKKIIGIIGNKRHGKDTIANFLVKTFDFRKVSLATPMKEVAKLLFPNWTDDTLENNKEMIDSEFGISPREFLQKFGTEFMQIMLSENPLYKEKVGRKFWVNRAIKEILNDEKNNNFVISDIRFPHELEAFNQIASDSIQVRFIKVIREEIPVDISHASEAFIKELPADYVIENNGSIKDLYDRICFIIGEDRE